MREELKTGKVSNSRRNDVRAGFCKGKTLAIKHKRGKAVWQTLFKFMPYDKLPAGTH